MFHASQGIARVRVADGPAMLKLTEGYSEKGGSELRSKLRESRNERKLSGDGVGEYTRLPGLYERSCPNFPPPEAYHEDNAKLNDFLPVDERVNTALVFIKPNASTRQVWKYCRKMLLQQGLKITQEGEVRRAEWEVQDMVDALHAQRAARFAVFTRPDRIKVPLDRQHEFLSKFKMTWTEALAQGLVLTAADAQRSSTYEGAMELYSAWERNSHNKMLLAPEVMVSRFEEEDIFVINGFYAQLRSKYTAPDVSLWYFVVGWKHSEMTWREVNEKVIGAADPCEAKPASLRARLQAHCRALGMNQVPNKDDNSVHASRGPLEALRERVVWLGATVDTDPYAEVLLRAGLERSQLDALLLNPVVDHQGKKGHVFSLTEGMDSDQAIALVLDLAAKGIKMPLNSPSWERSLRHYLPYIPHASASASPTNPLSPTNSRSARSSDS